LLLYKNIQPATKYLLFVVSRSLEARKCAMFAECMQHSLVLKQVVHVVTIGLKT